MSPETHTHHRPRLWFVAATWVAFVLLGILGAELYARRAENYLLLSWKLQKQSPYFFELDRLKVWNRRFVEQRREYFRNWPISLELFDADKPEPRYLFKPNLKMTIQRARLEPTRLGERVYRSTNSWGFRGPDFSQAKSPGTIRIVCLGASTTEGSQGDEETYPYYLRQALLQLIPGRTIEVINAGHHGQGIADLLEILRRRVLPLDPDIVIFYEAANNIGWGEFFDDPLPCALGSCWLRGYPRWYAWFYEHSAVFVLYSRRAGWAGRVPVPMDHTFNVSPPKPSALHYREELRKIAQETTRSGARFVLVSFVTLAHRDLTVSYQENPLQFDDLYKRRYPLTADEVRRIYDYYNRIARSVSRELNVPFVDMAREFPRKSRYFPFDSVHFSPEGNKVFAQILAKQLMHDRILSRH